MTNRLPFGEVRQKALRGISLRADQTSRLPRFVGSRPETARVLHGLKIACVGVGSVGGRIACHLARLGVAELWLIDPKAFKPESVLTHEIEPDAVMMSKVEYTGQRCKAISRVTRIYTFRGKVQDLPMDAFAGLDLVILAPDNLAAEIEVGQRCLHFGVRLVHAALFGETLTTQVRFFANVDADGPCPVCSFGEAERQQAFNEVLFSCEGATSPSATTGTIEQPTRSISSLCSMASDLAVNQVIRHVLGLGDPVADTILEYCGYTNEILTSPLERNRACTSDHTRITIANSLRDLARCTPAGLASDFGFARSKKSLTIAVDGATWLMQGRCRCAVPKLLIRLVVGETKLAGRCPRCQSTIHITPFHTHRSLPYSSLGPAAATSLSDFGAKVINRVLLRNAHKGTLVRSPGIGASNHENEHE